MKLNNKGFTLIEILATIIILSMIVSIMVPSVNYLIEKNKEYNYENLEKSIINAAKVYISDNRYDIIIDYEKGRLCNDKSKEKIKMIGATELTKSKLLIKDLIEKKELVTTKDGNVVNPKDSSKILDLETSYILIEYDCKKKDYIYTLENKSLIWIKK